MRKGNKSFLINHNYLLALLVYCDLMKSRYITLPTKVRLVKAVVFPVVMYGCESWTIKKAQRRRIEAVNYGLGENSSESLGLQEGPTSPS